MVFTAILMLHGFERWLLIYTVIASNLSLFGISDSSTTFSGGLNAR